MLFGLQKYLNNLLKEKNVDMEKIDQKSCK